MNRTSQAMKRAARTLFCAAVLCALAALGLAAQSSSLNGYPGQLYILRGRGSANEIKINAGDLNKAEGICDIAVSVDAANLAKNEIHLLLQPVGIVRYSKGSATCVRIPSQIRVIITGVNVLAAGPSNLLDGFLLTPEAYIASFGDKFDFPAGDNPDAPVIPLSTPGLLAPKPLLTVDASYTDAARRAHVTGTVVAEVTIGRDGRAAQGNLIKGLGYGLNEQVLRVLGMWRFTPAQLDGKAVAVRASLEMTFNIQ